MRRATDFVGADGVWLEFQSTLSMRRATRQQNVGGMVDRISIHALHEESDGKRGEFRLGHLISIHALHEESDVTLADFTSAEIISIHALHEESDLLADAAPLPGLTISIHALHEESDKPSA